VKVDTHQDAIVTGAVAFGNGRVYVPVSSLEEGTAVIRVTNAARSGAASPRSAATGKVIWKTYTISEAPQKTAKTAAGTQMWSSGGGVWSTPALDPAQPHTSRPAELLESSDEPERRDHGLAMDTAACSGCGRRGRRP
jgi:hypothetical protein